MNTRLAFYMIMCAIVIAAFASALVPVPPPIPAPTPAPAPLATNASVFFDWLPVIMTGIALVFAIISLYYALGVALGNPRVKAAALNEAQQAIGTVIIVIILLVVMTLVGQGTALTFKSALGTGTTSTNAQIDSICKTSLANAQVSFLNSNLDSSHYPKPYPVLPEPTTAVCNIILNPTSIGPVTDSLDYGLAATYVVVANLSYQSIGELSAAYNLDSLIYFLRSVQAYSSFCEPAECIFPFFPRETETVVAYKPWQGYIFQRAVMPSIITQANLSIYLFMAQLMSILILLLIWPYLLAAGLILRTFTLTRRAGGLIIAVVFVGLIIYPTIFLFQYSSLNNLEPPSALGSASPPPGAPLLGATTVPAISLCGITLSTPTLSYYSTGYPNQYFTTYQLGCYTSANELPLSYIYKGLQPNPKPNPSDTKAQQAAEQKKINKQYANMEQVCKSEGHPQSKTLICACPTGFAGKFGGNTPGGGLPTSSIPPCYTAKTLNFYVFPDAASVIRMYACYPPDYAGSPPFLPDYSLYPAYSGTTHFSNSGSGPSGLIDLEIRIVNSLDGRDAIHTIITLLANFEQAAQSVTGLAGSGSTLSAATTSLQIGAPCGIAAPAITEAIIGLINIYGIMASVGFTLPIINILMLLSATFGLSSLMGGETNIIGLSRFI